MCTEHGRLGLMHPLSIHVRTDACAEHMSQELVRARSTRQVLMCEQSAVPSKHAEHTHQELIRTLSICISFFRVCST